jgi:hypothetical protein
MRSMTVIAAILSAFCLAAGCGVKGSSYGEPITGQNIVRVGEILSHPEKYEKKTVLVEGGIIEECPVGGWFMLKDETAVVYVNLHPSYFAIPQALGRRVLVQGVVRKEGARVTLTGKGVTIR